MCTMYESLLIHFTLEDRQTNELFGYIFKPFALLYGNVVLGRSCGPRSVPFDSVAVF